MRMGESYVRHYGGHGFFSKEKEIEETLGEKKYAKGRERGFALINPYEGRIYPRVMVKHGHWGYQ
jgi:hypothetical protein